MGKRMKRKRLEQIGRDDQAWTEGESMPPIILERRELLREVRRLMAVVADTTDTARVLDEALTAAQAAERMATDTANRMGAQLGLCRVDLATERDAHAATRATLSLRTQEYDRLVGHAAHAATALQVGLPVAQGGQVISPDTTQERGDQLTAVSDRSVQSGATVTHTMGHGLPGYTLTFGGEALPRVTVDEMAEQLRPADEAADEPSVTLECREQVPETVVVDLGWMEVRRTRQV